MIIRQEQETDFDEIYNLVKVAFQSAEVRDGNEQDFVLNLRASINYIPELALVAENDGMLVGHVMLTKTFISTSVGEYEALLLAPLCVLIESRNQGIGGSLITESFRLAKEMGYKAVLLCGDPGYYQRFGFKTASIYGIKHQSELPDQYVMACPLFPKALDGIEGAINFC